MSCIKTPLAPVPSLLLPSAYRFALQAAICPAAEWQRGLQWAGAAGCGYHLLW